MLYKSTVFILTDQTLTKENGRFSTNRHFFSAKSHILARKIYFLHQKVIFREVKINFAYDLQTSHL